MTNFYFVSIVAIQTGIILVLFLGGPAVFGSSNATSLEDKLKLQPLQNLCGPLDSPCVDILHKGNQSIVLKGNEFVDNTVSEGMEFMLNPGLWPIVDFYSGKDYAINTVLYVGNEDFNSYRVILTTK